MDFASFTVRLAMLAELGVAKRRRPGIVGVALNVRYEDREKINQKENGLDLVVILKLVTHC